MLDRTVLALLCLVAATPAAAAERPRLGVLIVVDQLNAAFLDRHLEGLPGGFGRLAREGHRFRESRFAAAPTVTSAGHATLVTGAWANVHGVVANSWFDGRLGRATHSTEDARYQVLLRAPKKSERTAPTLLRAPTLGDALKTFDARAKVVSITGKDRSAILAGGASADLALWFDTERPFFTSSTWYAKDLPGWVTKVNEALGAAVLRAGFEPALPGGGITGKSPALEQKARAPSEEPALYPAIDRGVVDLALAALDGAGLGADAVPDLLVVGFSTFDFLAHDEGHATGALERNLRQVDGELRRLFDGLDKKVGKGRWTAALTSDHGGLEVPETLAARRIDAGRVDDKGLLAKLEETADLALGQADWFEGYWKPGYVARAGQREKLATIDGKLRAAARAVDGVLDLVPQRELLASPDAGPTHRFWLKGLYPGRSPDYFLVLRPNWLYGDRDRAGHAGSWLYDRAVPLLFLGAGVKKGVSERAEATDVAPTLARLLGVASPEAAEGRVLLEALLP